MKIPRLASAVCASAFALVSISSHTALIDRGSGLIYDTDLDITWVQDVNLASTLGLGVDNGKMNFQTALTFVDQLIHAGFDNWRLPTTPIFDPSCNEDFSPSYDHGYNCSGSEFGHLYYQELSNLGAEDENGDAQSGFGMINTGPFTNFADAVDRYWTSTYFPDGNNDLAFSFDIHNGQTEFGPLTNLYHVWAVHDGDIGAIPIPPALWLFGTGLLGLIGMARHKKAV